MQARLRIESIHACIRGVERNDGGEIEHGNSIRDCYIADNWRESTNDAWKRIQVAIKNHYVKRRLGR